MIDIVELKQEIKDGLLEVYTKSDIYPNKNNQIIYIRDTQNGETVKIGVVNNDKEI